MFTIETQCCFGFVVEKGQSYYNVGKLNEVNCIKRQRYSLYFVKKKSFSLRRKTQ